MTEEEETNETQTVGCVARLAEHESLDNGAGPWTFHGVLIGIDEITIGQSGDAKLWTAEALREGVDSLEGVPFVRNHPVGTPQVEDVTGQVAQAGFKSGVGIVYEAEVDDRELAKKLHRGRLDVSLHAVHRDGGTDEDTGAMIVEDVRFLDVAAVARGAAQSATVSDGESALAAELSRAELAEHVSALHASEGDDGAHGGSPQSTSGVDSPNSNTITMSETDTDEPEVAELQDRINELEDEADEATSEVAELQNEIEDLREERDELAETVEDVKGMFAAELADSLPLDEDTLAERFDVAELRDMAEDAGVETTVKTGGSPAPRSEDVDDEELAGDDADTPQDEEIEAALEKKETYEEMGWVVPASVRETLEAAEQ